MALNKLFPGIITVGNLTSVNPCYQERLENFYALKYAFRKLGVKQEVPIKELIRFSREVNYQFASWFKIFFDINASNSSDKNLEDDFYANKENYSVSCFDH